MKALFVSIAFFLYADKVVLTEANPPRSIQNETNLTLEECMKFRESSPAYIDQVLTGKGWKNTTAEDLAEEWLMPGEMSWQLRKYDSPAGTLHYMPGNTTQYEGPYIMYKPDEYTIDGIIKQASDKKRNLTKCAGAEHEEEFDDEDYENMSQSHFFNKDQNILFTKGECWGATIARIHIYGKKKK